MTVHGQGALASGTTVNAAGSTNFPAGIQVADATTAGSALELVVCDNSEISGTIFFGAANFGIRNDFNGATGVVTKSTTGTTTFSGVISGTVGHRANNNFTGTMVLSGASIYSGGTTVTASKLLVNNTTGSGTVGGCGEVFRIVLGRGNAFTEAFRDANKTWTNVFSSAGATTNLASIVSSFGGGRATNGTARAEGQYTFNSNTTLTWNSFSAVPEPSSALAGLLIGAGLLRRRRKNLFSVGIRHGRIAAHAL